MSYSHDNSSPINFPRKDTNYRAHSADERTSPTGVPRSKKDFGKIMQKNQRDDDEDENLASDAVGGEGDGEVATSDEAPQAPKKTNLSLFDLSSTTNALPRKAPLAPSPFAKATSASHEQGDINSALELGNSSKVKTDTVDATERGAAESPSEAYARLLNKKDDSRGFDSDSGSSSHSSKESFTTRFATEQSDLSYVNPMSLNQAFSTERVQGEKTVLPPSNIQDIVNQLVEKATEMKLDGKTETTITLKQPPILAGANLVVTAFDHARGEFNVAFNNLTQNAQNLLNMQVNQDSLHLALEQKGYTIHIISTTTLNESLVVQNPQSSRESKEQRDDRGGQSGQQGRPRSQRDQA